MAGLPAYYYTYPRWAGRSAGVHTMTTTRARIAQLIVVIFSLLSLCQITNSNPAERQTLDYTITEEQKVHLWIGRVGEDAMLDKKYTTDEYRSLRYSFLRQDQRIGQLFDINSVSGMLSTKKSVDREAFCEGPTQACLITFDIAARPMPVRFLEVIVIRIDIQDLNDNRPQFPSRSIEVPISESVLPGVKLVLPQAQDPDSEQNGVKTYELLSPTPKFDLSVRNMSDGSKELRLVVRDRLDREQMDRYSLQLVAWDGGTPALSGTLDIDVVVLDANDNNPKFDNTTYDITAREDTPIGSIILRVHASDKDTGPNAALLYSLTDQTKKKFGNIFGVKNRSGEIFLKGPLDFESEQIYQLTIAANDQGGWESVPAHARVNVHVVDVNDHAPVIRVNALTPSGQVEIPENAEPDTFVTHLSVEDVDSGINGEVTCFLQDYAVHLFRIEQIYTNEYTISTIGASFDRERQPTHLITLVCSDHGTPSLQSTKQIVVKLLDLNDHRPVFSREVYTESVRENNTLYTALLVVNATDQDEGENGRITYRLHPESQRLVKIDSATGLISTNALLDYEKMHQFQFRVIASDNGDPKRSATATVVLNLVDINDEAPVFRETSIDFGTYENQKAGTQIGTVVAIDPDSPPYNVVRYSQLAQRSAKNTFVVDPESGVITTRRVLDREYQPSYTFIVLAGNPGFPLTTSSVTVTVYVLDVNDNAPKFEFPTPVNNTVQVPYLATKRYVITRVLAYDIDFSSNAKLSYSLAKGNDDGLFEIDDRNGAVMVAVPLLQPKELFFKLLVMVRDDGESQKASVAELNVVVNKTATMVAHRKGHGKNSSGATNNLTIVIALCVATLVLIIVLLLAIVLIKRNQRRRGKNADVYRYTRRVDLASRAAAASPKHPPLDAASSVSHPGGGGGSAGYKDDSPPDGMPSPETPCSEKRLGGVSPSSCGGTGLPPPPPYRLQQTAIIDPRGGGGGGGGPGGGGAPNHVGHHGGGEGSLDGTGGHTILHGGNNQNAQEGQDQAGSDGEAPGAVKAYAYRDPRDPRGHDPKESQRHLPARHRLLYDPVQGTISKHTRLTEKDLEVHQLLHILMREGRGGGGQQDSDSVSGCSADMSNTDSGRGPSEDGDHGRHDPSGPEGTQPPPYEALWEEKRKSQLGGSGDLRTVPEEGRPTQHHHRPPSDINNIIPPYTTTTFSASPRDPAFTARGRHYNTTGGSGSGPTAHVKPQVVAAAAARRGANMAATRQQQQQQQQQQNASLNNRAHHLVGGKGIMSSTSPRSSPQGSRDSLNDHPSKPDVVTHHRVDPASLNNCRQGPGSNRSSGSNSSNKGSSGNKQEEVIYVNTFGHRMPLHPLGRVEETLDEGGGSDDSGSTTTSGSFEVDQGDRCSANSVQTVINATQMDTVV